jgi:hypothetical protein
MNRNDRSSMRLFALAVSAIAIAACSSDSGTINLLPKPESFKTDWLSFSGAKNDFELRSVTAEDLIGPGGQCTTRASTSVSTAAAQDTSSDAARAETAPATPPLIAGGIALQMTECDVVRRAGAPDKIDVGSNEQGERSVVLFFSHGPWPGTYRFAGGRLKSIDRGPEVPGLVKPKKPVVPAKKPAPV